MGERGSNGSQLSSSYGIGNTSAYIDFLFFMAVDSASKSHQAGCLMMTLYVRFGLSWVCAPELSVRSVIRRTIHNSKEQGAGPGWLLKHLACYTLLRMSVQYLIRSICSLRMAPFICQKVLLVLKQRAGDRSIAGGYLLFIIKDPLGTFSSQERPSGPESGAIGYANT
eukprot:147655-Pelagomonas_calceolata.AAC.1